MKKNIIMVFIAFSFAAEGNSPVQNEIDQNLLDTSDLILTKTIAELHKINNKNIEIENKKQKKIHIENFKKEMDKTLNSL